MVVMTVFLTEYNMHNSTNMNEKCLTKGTKSTTH